MTGKLQVAYGLTLNKVMALIFAFDGRMPSVSGHVLISFIPFYQVEMFDDYIPWSTTDICPNANNTQCLPVIT
jgi:hypothetical protein